MKAGGSSVQYIRGDFSDSRDAERIIKTIKRQFGEINGVIHSAGAPALCITPLISPNCLLMVFMIRSASRLSEKSPLIY